MPPARSRLRWLQLLAALCLVLMLVVTVASAWLRLTLPQNACDAWPACRQALQVAPAVVTPGPLAQASTLAAVRSAHRMSGSGILLAALLFMLLGWRGRAAWRHALHLALALVLLALGLAVLGIAAGGSRALGVLLGNMLGGLVMLALAWRLNLALRSPAGPAAHLGRWPIYTALAWFLQAALGLVSGSGHGTIYPALHILAGLGVVGLSWAFAYVLKQRGHPLASLALLGLALWQLALGLGGALSNAAPALVLLHNTGAALGLALLLGLIEPRPQRAADTA